MRIVGLTNGTPANAQYRVGLPLAALAQRGHQTESHEWTPDAAERLRSVLRDADAVLLWRLYMDAERRFASALRDAGVAIVWDNDDDLVRVRPQVNTKATVAREQAHRQLSAVMRLADAVTTTSGELARRFRRMGAGSVKVIDNYIATDSLQPPRPPREDGVTIGWIAAAEHRADLKQLQLRSVLERVLRRHPDVRVVSIGVELGIRSDRYTWRRGVDFPQLSAAASEFDIAIAPIADASFNRARSRVKLKEYAAAGVPWLASPIGPYREMGEQQGGRLVPDALWQRRLEELIGDADARRELGRRAAAWAQTQTIDVNAEQWEATFAEAVERARGRRGEAAAPPAEPAGDALAAQPERARGGGGFLRRLTRRDRAGR
jgi:glycosyltransferase involved in cell wall biosynthesis